MKHLTYFVAFLFLFASVFARDFTDNPIFTQVSLNYIETYYLGTQNDYTFHRTDKFNSFGGEVSIAEDLKSVSTSVWSDDSDVYFQITNGNRYCIFDSYLNPLSMKRVISPYEMQGALCSVEISGEIAFITVMNSEISDCKWNGAVCSPVDDGMRTTFSLDAPDFSVVSIIDPVYQNSGGRIVLENASKQFYTIIQSSIADLYVNISSTDEKSWCVVSSECTPDNWKPVSLIYAHHDIICSTREISYHQFKITARRPE